MKNSVETPVSPEVAHRRAIKREASRRCRARAKAIENGQLLTPELLVRSVQPTAKKVENFKVDLGDKVIRLNRNGGDKVAIVVNENGDRQRKSFKDLDTAIQAFKNMLTGKA